MRPALRAPLFLIVVGLATFVSSLLIDGGFFRGLFQGMTIALMVAAAYVFGRELSGRKGKDAPEDPNWLPSRDRD